MEMEQHENDTTMERTIEEHKIGDWQESELLERAQKIVDERTSDWDIQVEQAENRRIPEFDRNEIELGVQLGKGGFFTVN